MNGPTAHPFRVKSVVEVGEHESEANPHPFSYMAVFPGGHGSSPLPFPATPRTTARVAQRQEAGHSGTVQAAARRSWRGKF